MRLYKKLLIGSLALTLALGHLHAMEGTSFSTDPKPPYSIYESLFVPPCQICGPRVNNYSSHYKDKDNANLIHRELAGNKIIKHYTKEFGDCFLSHGTWRPLPIPFQSECNRFNLLRVYGEADLKLFTNILVVNGLFNENTLRHSSIKSLFSLDEKYRNCVIFTTSDKCNFDFIYNQQMFPIPKNDSGNVDNDQLFNNLCKLLESIDVLTIAIRDRSENYCICRIILNLKELNRETGMCTFVDFKGNEIQTDITFLANLLKENQVEFMHVHFLDKIPKDKQLKIIYHCLAKEPVSINWHDVKEKEEGSEAEKKDTKEKEESSAAEE